MSDVFFIHFRFLVNSGAFLNVNTSQRLHLCATPAVISCYAGIILKIMGHKLCLEYFCSEGNRKLPYCTKLTRL